MATKKAGKKTVKKAAKKTTKKTAAKKAVRNTSMVGGTPAKKASKASGKRTLIAPRGDKRYVRRDTQGQFRESDDQGASLAADIRTKAKTTVKPGQGDRGDQK